MNDTSRVTDLEDRVIALERHIQLLEIQMGNQFTHTTSHGNRLEALEDRERRINEERMRGVRR